MKAVDAAGNESSPSAGVDFTVDTIAPEVPPVVDMPNDTIIGDTNKPTFTGTVTDKANTHKVIVTIVGTGLPNGGWTGEAVIDKATGQWTLNYTGNINLEGDYTVSLKAVDAAGNESTSSAGIDFTVDTTPLDITPVFNNVADTIMSDVEQQTMVSLIDTGDDGICRTNKPTMLGMLLDDSVKDVSLYLNGSKQAIVVSVDDGVWNYSFDEPLMSGLHTVEIVYTDGNQETEYSDSIDFVVDNSVHEEKSNTEISEVVMSGYAPVEAEIVKLYIDDELHSTVDISNGKWELVLESSDSYHSVNIEFYKEDTILDRTYIDAVKFEHNAANVTDSEIDTQDSDQDITSLDQHSSNEPEDVML